MNVLGLVLELNPFHNGHFYFIKEAIKKANPDCTIAVLSSNFTMRGDVSVIDKFQKTRMCLSSGIDLVLELPFLSAVASADYFGYNAIKILTDFFITDLAFGTELADYSKLSQMKQYIDSWEYQQELKNQLAKGLSYSSASFRALHSLTDNQELLENFTLPNNTLGIQYLRSLDQQKKKPNIHLIQRIDNHYYQTETTGSISSATAIRNLLANAKNIDEFVPDFARGIYQNPIECNRKLLQYLQYLFSVHQPSDFTEIWGISEGIENRIAYFISLAKSYEELIATIQTKRYPVNKIKRLFLHILLNSSKQYENRHCIYHRMLGASKKGLDYIKTLPKEFKAKIITTFKNRFDDDFVLKELQATKLYGLITDQPKFYCQEFKIPILKEETNEY